MAILSININNTDMNLLLEAIDNKYEIIAADNEFDAVIELQKRREIKAIVLDTNHAETDYWSFIYHIKTSKFYDKPLFIVANNNEIQDKIKEAEFDCSLLKQLKPKELLKQMEVEIQSI